MVEAFARIDAEEINPILIITTEATTLERALTAIDPDDGEPMGSYR